MRAVVTVLEQAVRYWQSESRAETIVAVVTVVALAGLVLAPQLRSLVERIL